MKASRKKSLKISRANSSKSSNRNSSKISEGDSLKISDRSSRDRSDKKKKPRETNTLTFLNIPEELYFEVLRAKLEEYTRGVVIASLNSIFLNSPIMVLKFLLREIGNILFLQCILFSYTYKDFISYQEHMCLEKIKKDTNRMQEILNMDDLEYDTLNPTEMKMFKNIILKSRKIKILERKIKTKYVLIFI